MAFNFDSDPVFSGLSDTPAPVKNPVTPTTQNPVQPANAFSFENDPVFAGLSAAPVNQSPGITPPADVINKTTAPQPTVRGEMRSYEPSILDRIMDFFPDNKARASNELAVRKIAEREGVGIDQAYRDIGFGAARPMLNPEGRAPVRAAAEGSKIFIKRSPTYAVDTANAVLRTVRGGDTTVDDSGLDELVNWTTTERDPDYDMNYDAVYNAGSSLGFSLATMASAATTYAGVQAATGNPVAATVAGMTASGATAFRASKDQFLSSAKEMLDKQSMEVSDRPINQEEWDIALEEFNSEANKYGAWEAIPEAVSNIIFVKTLAAPLKGVGKSGLAAVKEKASRVVADYLKTQASETGTEVITQMGQSQAEANVGLRDRAASLPEALREVLPSTILLTSVMNVGSAGAKYFGGKVDAKSKNAGDAMDILGEVGTADDILADVNPTDLGTGIQRKPAALNAPVMVVDSAGMARTQAQDEQKAVDETANREILGSGDPAAISRDREATAQSGYAAREKIAQRLPENLPDARLARNQFRNKMESLVTTDFLKGGGVAATIDPSYQRGESDGDLAQPITGRTPSLNPEWAQALLAETGATTDEVGKAVTKALAGERLGLRQARIVTGILDHVSDKRNSPETLAYMKRERENAQHLRRVARGELPSQTEFDQLSDQYAGSRMQEKEYPAHWDGEVRSQYEILNDAVTANPEETDRILTASAKNEWSTMTTIQMLQQRVLNGGGNAQQDASGSVEQGAVQPQEGLPAAVQNGVGAPIDVGTGQPAINPEQSAGIPATGSVESGNQAQVAPAYDLAADPVFAEPAPDRREHAEPVASDNRNNKDRRAAKRVDEMTLEEAREALRTSDKSELRNERAYNEDERLEHQAFFDVDDFKNLNDKLTYAGGDLVIDEIGRIMAEEASDAVIPYHLHGDEFIIQSNDEQALTDYSNRVQSKLKSLHVPVKLPNGSLIEHTGIGVSYGIGSTKEQAESRLKTDKKRRQQSGQRSGVRNGEPATEAGGEFVSASGQATEGKQDRAGGTDESEKVASAKKKNPAKSEDGAAVSEPKKNPAQKVEADPIQFALGNNTSKDKYLSYLTGRLGKAEFAKQKADIESRWDAAHVTAKDVAAATPEAAKSAVQAIPVAKESAVVEKQAAQAAIKSSDIPKADQIKLAADLRKGDVTPEDVHSMLDVAPKKEILSEPTAENNYAKWIDNLSKKFEQESYAQSILDDMEETGESPQKVAEDFWNKTYPLLPEKGKALFRREYKAYTGRKLEDGESPMDMIDLGNEAGYLEDTNRGFVVLMREANNRFKSGQAAELPLVAPKAESDAAEGKPKARESAIDAALRSVGIDPNAPPDKAKALRREAEKLMKESAAMLAGIPPGQPVQSTRHRNLLDKSRAKADKASELYRQADDTDTNSAAKDEPVTAQPEQVQPAADITYFTDVSKRLYSGNIMLDEYKSAFELLAANKEAITNELMSLTKDELLKKMGGMSAARYKNEKKADVAHGVYIDMLETFVLGSSFQFGMGKNAHEGGIRNVVNKQTDESLKEFSEKIKKQREEYKQRMAETVAGAQDPVTLDDHINAIKLNMSDGMSYQEARMALTIEQRARFDELTGEATRKERATRKESQQEARVRAPGEEVGTSEIINTKHTKLGHDLWQFDLDKRVEPDEFKALVAQAKQLGGNYSSYRGGGAIPGWQFRTEESAKAFKTLIAGDTTAAKEVMQARRDVYADDRSQSAVERLNEMADKLDENADDALAADRKTNTVRRARFAASAENAANRNKAMAQTMRNIANGIENENAKFLDRIRTKSQVEMLSGFVNTAQSEQLRFKYPSYADYEKHLGEAPTMETADYVNYPAYTLYRSDLARLGRELMETEGTKLIGNRIMKVADDTSAAYTKFAKENLDKVNKFRKRDGSLATFSSKRDAEASMQGSGLAGKAMVLTFKRNEHLLVLSPSEAIVQKVWDGDTDKRITLNKDTGAEIVEKIGKAARRGSKISVPWQFDNAYDKLKRLASMNIETPAELRSAAREFIALREAPAEESKIKKMERAMVGRAKDGLDFFPTPAATADQMIETADIQEGMSVLEPSAGMGHIAERIREAGVDPDVIEMESKRYDLLEAKGFNVIGRDFMDVTEGQYDRIIMNPPFSDGRDAIHVQHAYGLLKPGGRLVAIMGEGSFFRSDKKAEAFRDWLDTVGGTSEKLDEGTFLDSSLPVNTGVNARMVVIEKLEAKFSKGQPSANTHTVTTLKAAMDKAIKSFGYGVDKLLDTGKVKIVAGAEADKVLAIGGGDVLQSVGSNSLRYWITNVRGGWTKDKIRKELKKAQNKSSGSFIHRQIAGFDNPSELSDHIFYHGTGGYVSKGLKPSITQSEREAEQSGGGGYGERYWAISLSKSKNVASNFTGQSRYGAVYPVILRKGANVISMPEIQDAIELEDHIVDLWTRGIDAVRIGDWSSEFSEQELAVLNPRAIFKYENAEHYQVFQKKRFESLTDLQIEKIYQDSVDAIPNLDAIKLLPKDARDAALRDIPKLRFSKSGNPLAFFNPADGITYFIADNINKNSTDAQIRGLILHEISVHSLNLNRDSAEFKNILKQLQNMRKLGNKKVQAAYARAKEAGTTEQHMDEESLGYLVEGSPDISIVQKFINWMKSIIRSVFPGLKFNDSELVQMARDALKAAPESLAGNQVGDGDAVMASKEAWRKQTEIAKGDGKDVIAAKLLATHDDLFQTPPTASKTIQDIASDAGGDTIAVQSFPPDQSQSAAWVLYVDGKDGKKVGPAFIYQYPNGTVEMDVLKVGEGNGGNVIYHIAGTYAHNNGLIFNGDRAGLSHVAQVRRLENMLSNALKYRTTEHLHPHELQMHPETQGVVPLKWKPDDDAYNMRQLVAASVGTTLNLVPEIADLRYNFDTKKFEDANGKEVTDDRFDDIVNEARQRPLRGEQGQVVQAGRNEAQTPVGRSTLKRAIVLSTVSQGKGGQGWGRILAAIGGQQDQLDEQLKDIFYSRSNDQKNTPQPSEKTLLTKLKESQPLDAAFRLAFELPRIPKLTTAAHDWVVRKIKHDEFSDTGYMAWANPIIEHLRAGLIDRHGLSDEYIRRDEHRESDKRSIQRKGVDFINQLIERNMDINEAKVFKAMLEGEPIPDSQWNDIAPEIRENLDAMGSELVELGWISAETYDKHRGTWLHRVYEKHEKEQGTLQGWVSRGMAKRRAKMYGNQFRQRGMNLGVTMDDLLRATPQDWFGRKRNPAKEDTHLKGEKFIVLDRIQAIGQGTETFEGMKNPGRKPKIRERVYWPAGTPLPAKYGAWENRGTWEVTGFKQGKVTLWRDYSKAERESMGEILDARYVLGKTYMLLANDLANARFFDDVAKNPEWTWAGSEPPPSDLTTTPQGAMSTYVGYEWVLVPETKLVGTGKYQWGPLAGQYIRAEIFRDLHELQRLRLPGVWKSLLTQWKVNKTAYSPVTHMNNVMSNFILMDLADVRMRDLTHAVQAIVTKSPEYLDAEAHGLFGSDMMSQEIRDRFMQPLLDTLQKEQADNMDMTVFSKAFQKAHAALNAATTGMRNIYTMEDEIFRMATYVRNLSRGMAPDDAARQARAQFLNYDIRAPWINAARETLLPFISYTYRAVPILAEAIAHRPWKLAKYVSIFYGMNALAYLLAPSDDDEDRERRSLPEAQSGNTWLGMPRMLRMPYLDENENPVFLDVRRWIPAGDVYDMNQGSSALPVPAPLQFGGPLMLAAELALNKSGFTGKDITNDLTDTGMEKAEKVGGYLWKTWMPNAPWIPGSWSADKLMRSAGGGRDMLGRDYSLGQAAASAAGIKLTPQDVDMGFAYYGMEFERVGRALEFEMMKLSGDYQRGLISDDDYESEREDLQEKMQMLSGRASERFADAEQE